MDSVTEEESFFSELVSLLSVAELLLLEQADKNKAAARNKKNLRMAIDFVVRK